MDIPLSPLSSPFLYKKGLESGEGWAGTTKEASEGKINKKLFIISRKKYIPKHRL